MKEFVTMSADTNSTEPPKVSPTNADNNCEQISAEEVLTADSRNNESFPVAAVSNPTVADDDANHHLTPTYSKQISQAELRRPVLRDSLLQNWKEYFTELMSRK
jgi:hypothetical protein